MRSDIFGVRNSTNGALERRLGDIEHTFGTVRAAKKRSRIRGAMYPSITTFPLREWVAARHRTDQVTAFGGYGEFTPLLFDTASPQHLPVRARRSVVRRRTLRQGQRPVAQRDSNSRCRLERAARSTHPPALGPAQTAPAAEEVGVVGHTFGIAVPRGRVLAALLVALMVSMVAFAPSIAAPPSEAIDSVNATWTPPAEGTETHTQEFSGRCCGWS